MIYFIQNFIMNIKIDLAKIIPVITTNSELNSYIERIQNDLSKEAVVINEWNKLLSKLEKWYPHKKEDFNYWAEMFRDHMLALKSFAEILESELNPSKKLIFIDFNFRFMAKALEIFINKTILILDNYKSLLTLSIDSEEYNQKYLETERKIKNLYDQQVLITRLF